MALPIPGWYKSTSGVMKDNILVYILNKQKKLGLKASTSLVLTIMNTCIMACEIDSTQKIFLSELDRLKHEQ